MRLPSSAPNCSTSSLRPSSGTEGFWVVSTVEAAVVAADLWLAVVLTVKSSERAGWFAVFRWIDFAS